MIPFKERSGLKQYMPNKPIKEGIKVWMRADAENGYVSAFEAYTGKKRDTAEMGLGAEVVKVVSKQLYGSYSHVHFNNFFASVDLALDLFRSGLHSCGTLRTNRKGFPVAFEVCQRRVSTRGKSKIRQQSNIMVSVWQENRPVVLIATNSNLNTTNSVLCKNNDGMSKSYPCPKFTSSISTWAVWTKMTSFMATTTYSSNAGNTTSMYFGSCLTWQ